jgi:hypothetical protein
MGMRGPGGPGMAMRGGGPSMGMRVEVNENIDDKPVERAVRQAPVEVVSKGRATGPGMV